MFDIGFWEIAVIAVVALLVVGPDEFPALVRNISAWIGKIRSFMSETKNDLEREFAKAEELKQLIERETHIAALHEKIDARKINTETVSAGKAAPAQAAARSAVNETPAVTATEDPEPQKPQDRPAHGSND